MAPVSLDWIEVRADALVLRVSRDVYSEEALFRTCYLFTDRCYLFLEADGSDHIAVRFSARRERQNLHDIVGEFGNELVNQRLRQDLARETRMLRESIVRRAFADAEFEG